MADKIPAPLKSRSLTIVIPAHNESGNIPILLESLKEAYNNKLKFSPKTLIIDDGSNDGTGPLLDNLTSEYPFYKIIHHPKQQGIAGALRTAMLNSDTDWFFLIPADLESDPEADLMPILAKAGEGWDVITGWRQGRGGIKKILSLMANIIAGLFLKNPVHDMNWIKLIRRDALLEITFIRGYYRYMVPILSLKGYKIAEIRTAWHPRRYGRSKFDIRRIVVSGVDFFRLLWIFNGGLKK